MAISNTLRSAYLVLPLALMACSNAEGPKTVSATPAGEAS